MKTHCLQFFVAASVAALLLACTEREIRIQPAEAQAAESDVVLRSYEVPAGHAQQVKTVLGNVFYGVKEKTAARAEISPDGQLLVIAPAGVHRGVTELLERMAKRGPAPVPPTVELRVWLVIGEKAGETALGPGLGEVERALTAVAGAQGPMRFTLLESLRVHSLSDERGEADGQYAQLREVASVTGETILTQLDVELIGGGQLKTRLALEPGKLMILGEAGIRPERMQPPPVEGAGPFTVFYVVRASTQAAPAGDGG